jgi:DNA mismatch repair protein MutH
MAHPPARTRLRVPPPRDVAELRARASALQGRTLDEIALALGFDLAGQNVRTKGKVGELLERALGASGGAGAVQDFPHLGVELKSIPLDARGTPVESTFVCAISVADAEYAEWETSWARRKLSHVLWIPLVPASAGADGPVVVAEPAAAVSEGGRRRVGEALFWQPTAEQEAVLRADFDCLMGLIGVGDIERLTAREGRWLQVRPKAAHGRVRTVAWGADGERIDTVPRGFYLRSRFTGAILRDPTAVPGTGRSPAV